MNREALTRRRRRIATVAALGVTALLLAGCGGNRPGSGPPSPQTTYQQALAYARCVRAHGDPGFPDPNSQGLFPHPAGPQYRSATSACSHLLPSQPLTASQKRQHVVLALKFTACMRSHGYPDFPDPIVKDGGTAIGFGFGHIDQGTPLFHRAIQACRRFEPGLAAQRLAPEFSWLGSCIWLTAYTWLPACTWLAGSGRRTSAIASRVRHWSMRCQGTGLFLEVTGGISDCRRQPSNQRSSDRLAARLRPRYPLAGDARPARFAGA